MSDFKIRFQDFKLAIHTIITQKICAMICLHDSSGIMAQTRTLFTFFVCLSIADFSMHLIFSMFLQLN